MRAPISHGFPKRARALAPLVAATLALSGCAPRAVEGDAGADAEPSESIAEVGAEGAAGDGDGPSVTAPGPVTLVLDGAGWAEERLCDLDGDGLGDNAVADLGEPASTLMIAVLNAAAQGYITSRLRMILHFPWLEDTRAPHDPETTLLLLKAQDTDVPSDRLDDFSGHEPFYVHPQAIDACGEPHFVYHEASLLDGVLLASAERSNVPLTDDFIIHGAQMMGSVGPSGASVEAEICGYGTINDLGTIPGLQQADGLTMLEGFLLGGASVGMPSIPGIDADVDVDGDGLERVLVDADGRITECIDGDATSIPGADCWADPRIADGFSLNLTMTGIPALFAGRPPGWEGEVVGSCDDGLPETSIFDPP